MRQPEVVVVAETPSLARSIVDLLETSNIPTKSVSEAPAEPRGREASRRPVLVVACNESYCATARRWLRGEFQGTDLIVVGSRDPLLVTSHRMHVIPLPMVPARFLSLLREILSGNGRDDLLAAPFSGSPHSRAW